MSATTYTIDPAHTIVEFKVRHMMVAHVRGQFPGVSGAVVIDPDNPTSSKVDATIDATTLHTRDEQRDAHLKSADFFDVAKYPTITFASKKVSGGGGEWKLTGDLTIHGVTREVTLDVEGPTPEIKDPWGNLRRGVAAKTKIQRKDFGLMWNVALEAGGVLVGEEVQIHIEAELVRQ